MATWFEQFKQISTQEQKNHFRQPLLDAGYASINEWVQSFYDALKKMDEESFKTVEGWIELGKELIPDMVTISPAWENLWDELMTVYQYKVDFFMEVPKEERDGSWQVLFDNPLTTDGIICHPNKSFQEATYLAAKFQLKQKRAEIIQLQKVTKSVTRQK